MTFIHHLVAAVTAYLLGSIPTGYLVARAKAVDIRRLGSGNIGATNVFRILGRKAGLFVLLADVLKGYLACSLAPSLGYLWGMPLAPDAAGYETLKLLAGFCAILGHSYTCWLGFRGGKGVATSAGVFLALAPAAGLITVLVWTVLLVLSRYVSLASLAACITLPVAIWATGQSITLLTVTTVLSALVIYKHRSNIQRLLAGTESRFGQNQKTNTP